MPKYSISRTVTREFTELGEGISVTIRNPMMCTDAQLNPGELGSDEATIRARSAAWLAGFIVDWTVPDPRDDSDDPQLLGAPSGETLQLVPVGIVGWIGEQVKAARTPL